ncbi:MAG: glycerate kinase family protein [Planctomycetota bacterium]|jgi:glycerate kinase
MKIVVAMDSFKGTIGSCEACEIVAESIRRCVPGAELVIKPMADGGEGTAKALIKACGGKCVKKKVMGPLAEMEVEAGFAWFEEDRTALVEMACASGLELLRREQMNPLRTTTYGTGQLIKAALDYGANKILLAVGGSATVDGGIGAAAALGWEFIDEQDRPVQLGGAGLQKIMKINKPADFKIVPMEVLCDVDNPLCGEEGAARVYGPQKGATEEMVEELEKGLAHLAKIVEEQLGCKIKDIPGAGAAGGLAAGAIAFMNADVVSGIETVMKRSNLADELELAEWVITGEGCFDEQSLMGKVVSGVSALARRFGVRVAVIAGQIRIEREEYQKLGIVVATGCRREDMSLDDTLSNCRELLGAKAEEFAKEYLC